MNLKKLTYKNFKEGLYKVTPLQLCSARISGYIGTIVGMMIGIFVSIYSHSWWLVIVLIFVVWLQAAALLGDIQQRKALKESEQQIMDAMRQLESIQNKKVK